MSQCKGRAEQNRTRLRQTQQEDHLGWKLPRHFQGWNSGAHHPLGWRTTLTEATGSADTDPRGGYIRQNAVTVTRVHVDGRGSLGAEKQATDPAT